MPPTFANVRATGFYRYKLAAFQDLYGVNLEQARPEQIEALPGRFAQNYRDRRWLYTVLTERANIELMIVDPYWNRYGFAPEYTFESYVFNVTPLLSGFHRAEYAGKPNDDLYRIAGQLGLAVGTLDEYVALMRAPTIWQREATKPKRRSGLHATLPFGVGRES